jgi:hypothetical protein
LTSFTHQSLGKKKKEARHSDQYLYYFGASIGGSQFEASLGKKLVRPNLKEQAWHVGVIPVIPATQEAEVGEGKSEIDPGAEACDLVWKNN